MPYRSLNGESGENGALAGIEGKLLEYLAVTLNFTLKFRLLNNYESTHTLDKKGMVFKEVSTQYLKLFAYLSLNQFIRFT